VILTRGRAGDDDFEGVYMYGRDRGGEGGREGGNKVGGTLSSPPNDDE